MVSKKFLVSIATLFCAASVQAGQIPLSSSISADHYLTAGQSQNMQIDVNGMLSANGLSRNSIVSGLLTVSGYSAADFGIAGSSVTNQNYAVSRVSTDCNKGKCKVVSDNYHVKQFNTNYSDAVADQMQVVAGGSSGSDTVTTHDVYSSDSGQLEDTKKRTGSEKGGYNYFFNEYISHYDSLSGDLVVQLSLDSAALNDLFADGILNLSVKSVLGQFTVSDVHLDFIAQEKAAPAAGVVPLPTSLLLTGLGLAALAASRRRKA